MNMGKCKITSLSKACAYNGDGVVELILLDFDDLIGLQFSGPSSGCLVSHILRADSFTSVDLRDNPGQYTGQMVGGLFQHNMEMFIADLGADILADLHLASENPQTVVFRTANGKYFIYGHEQGASVSYSLQTADGAGALVTIRHSSSGPLLEVTAQALEPSGHPFEYTPLWTTGATCQVDGGLFTGNQQATLAVRTSTITGQTLDVNGNPTSQSGLLPAALLLEGEEFPQGYAIAGRFAVGAILNGTPTVRYNPEACADGQAAPWILESGAWDMSAYWLNNGIWNY